MKKKFFSFLSLFNMDFLFIPIETLTAMLSNLIFSNAMQLDTITKMIIKKINVSPGRPSCFCLKHKHGALLPLRVLSSRSKFSLQTHIILFTSDHCSLCHNCA